MIALAMAGAATTETIGGLGAGAAGATGAAIGENWWNTPEGRAQKEFRDGLNRTQRGPKTSQAHHLIPKNRAMRELIEQTFGPNSDVIDDPAVNGWWWEADSHRRNASRYDKQLRTYIRTLPPDATIAQVIEYAKWLTERMKSGEGEWP